MIRLLRANHPAARVFRGPAELFARGWLRRSRESGITADGFLGQEGFPRPSWRRFESRFALPKRVLFGCKARESMGMLGVMTASRIVPETSVFCGCGNWERFEGRWRNALKTRLLKM